MVNAQDGLVLRYEYRDTDGTGVLGAEVRFGVFSGAPSAWFTDADVLEFANQLTTYPLHNSGCYISGGSGSNNDFGEDLGLIARPVGGRGQVGLLTHLASPTEHPTYPESSLREVRVEVLTSYEALGQLSASLKRLVTGNADEALLGAEVLG